MRILHAQEISGQSWLSADGLRRLGHTADVFSPEHPFAYARPEHIPPPRNNWRRGPWLAVAAARLGRRYDVFHFHTGRSLWPYRARQVDARMLRRLGKTVVSEYWGSDIRMPSIEAQRNPYLRLAPDPAGEADKRELLARWAEISDGHVVISDHWFDPMLRDHFPHIHVVRQRADTERLRPVYPSAETEEPVIVHNPSNRDVKGTAHVRRAVSSLRARGLRFRYEEVFGVPYHDALRIYATADIFVEQLLVGSHGVSAVEGMSLGKPVVTYLLPELEGTYPAGMPIVNANPDTIEGVLEGLLLDPAGRRRLGEASRRYAERVHDSRVVGRRLLDAYRAMGAAG